jgi:hypothetical protein
MEAQAESYQDCILNNMKYANNSVASLQIKNACLDKTTPKKCRPYLEHNFDNYLKKKNGYTFDELTMPSEQLLSQCLEQCEEAVLFERKFGECSTE